MIKRELSPFLFLIIFLLTNFQFSPAIASSEPIILPDDTPLISDKISEYDFDPRNYTFNVQPGNYAVLAVLHGCKSGEPSQWKSHMSVFSYANYSHRVFHTEFNPRRGDAKIIPESVKFFVIDGTNFAAETSYYVQCRYIENIGHPGYLPDTWWYIEIENGNNTGMRTLQVNSSVTDEITSEIFDAYQVYLEAGRAYNITLTGGSTLSYDLYLTNGSTLASSCIASYGVNEKIVSFIPEETGHFCIVVTNPVWTNAEYELEIKRTKPILPTTPSTPSTEETSSETSETTPTTSAGSFPGLFTILGCFATLVVLIRRHKN